MSWIFYMVALVSGAANPFQSGANAELNKQLGEPIWAGLLVYITGLIFMIAVQLLFGRSLPPWLKFQSVPWYAWLGGVISVASTMAALTLAQKLGSGLFTGLSITASILTSVLLDQFGLIGFKQHSLSPGRIAGCALMVAGLWLVARF